MSIRWSLVVFSMLVLSTFVCSSASAALMVGAGANGRFGTPESGGTGLVEGWVFTGAGETVTITATGTINIGGGPAGDTGPDGLDLSRGVIIGGFPEAYTPLEEQLVDASVPVPTTDHASTVLDVGALMAAFVPESVASAPGFAPLDDDVSLIGIPSGALFLVGSGPTTFTSPGAGRLYFGINEPFVSNNSGAFSVDVSPVPEPGTLLLVVSLVGLGAILLRGHGFGRAVVQPTA